MAPILAAACGLVSVTPAQATPPRSPDRTVACDVLIVGGGLAGTAAAYEALHDGREVCLTELTDWVGGQVSSQGVAALDETNAQRVGEVFPRGYREFRDRLRQSYGRLSPGNCWVSAACFIPADGHRILLEMLHAAARRGGGRLHWFPHTVIKDLETVIVPRVPPAPPSTGEPRNPYQAQAPTEGEWITGAIAIQHQAAPGTAPLHATPLSQLLADAYDYADSARLQKTIIRFVPTAPTGRSDRWALGDPAADHPSAPISDPSPDHQSADHAPAEQPNWYVIEATETGELLALADVPYRLGIDARSAWEPSASATVPNPYCPQSMTYTFAIQALDRTAPPPTHTPPPDYDRNQPLYSYDAEHFNFENIFTYRRIWATRPEESLPPIRGDRRHPVHPGDISMQNWQKGNNYSPGTPEDNLIYTRAQLQANGQLDPGGWRGGLRIEALAAGEATALGYFHWLVAGTTDAELDDDRKQPEPFLRLLTGADSPMGTGHGLAKYPYIRESRRAIGRPSWGNPDGFTVREVDLTRNTLGREVYRDRLDPVAYRQMRATLAGFDTLAVLADQIPVNAAPLRSRAYLYPDSVGIAHYPIDFHPCRPAIPPIPQAELSEERFAHGSSYPFQIPLRSLIPQRIDNLLVVGKSIATSHIAAAAYRVHPFEWASGAAAGVAVGLAIDQRTPPYTWTDHLPRPEPLLEALQRRLESLNNPIAFPGMSIFQDDWGDRLDPS